MEFQKAILLVFWRFKNQPLQLVDLNALRLRLKRQNVRVLVSVAKIEANLVIKNQVLERSSQFLDVFTEISDEDSVEIVR